VKSKPGEINYGAQTGSLNHLMMEMLNQSTGMKTVFIPYRGAPDSLTGTISGFLQYNYSSLGSVIGHVRAGTLRPLAVTSSKRSPVLKDVPTVAEAGFPELTTDSWWGLFVPTGTPPDVVRKISTDVNEILKRPDVARRFAEFGAGPRVYMTGDTDYNELLESAARHSPDLVITCINGGFNNLSHYEAAQLVGKIRPKAAIPCHYDMFPDNAEDPNQFRTSLKLRAPGVAYQELEHGKVFVFAI